MKPVLDADTHVADPSAQVHLITNLRERDLSEPFVDKLLVHNPAMLYGVN